MYKQLIFIFLGCFVCKSQIVNSPKYRELESINMHIKKTKSISVFLYTNVQYIGELRDTINLSVNELERFNPILKENYSNKESDAFAFFKSDFDNLSLLVDTNQNTPLKKTKIELTDEEIEILNSGRKLESEILNEVSYYSAFPLTIHNYGIKDALIGFGTTIPLELEAKNRNGEWKVVHYWRKYVCGTGIKVIKLKPNQIATVFLPNYDGNFETTMRYRLKNVLSNEFTGKINDSNIK